MTIVQNGIRLLLQGWRSILALTILISLGCFVLSLSLSDVFTQTAVLTGGRELRAQQAVTFTTFYKEGAVSKPSPVALRTLTRELDARRAYSAVINNSDVSQSPSVENAPIILLFGDVIPDLYPALRLCSPVPCAMRTPGGPADAEATLLFRGMTIPFSGNLPRHATWFDPNSTGIPLAQHIVVRLQPESIGRLDKYAQEELVSRTVMLHPSSPLVEQFVGATVRSGVYLVPSSLAVDQPQKFREVLSRSGLYLTGFGAYIILMFSVMSTSLNNLLEQQSSRFQVYRMSGATVGQLRGIVAFFLALSIITLPVLMCAPLILLGGSFAEAFLVIVVGCLAVWIAEMTRARRSVADPEVGKML